MNGTENTVFYEISDQGCQENLTDLEQCAIGSPDPEQYATDYYAMKVQVPDPIATRDCGFEACK